MKPLIGAIRERVKGPLQIELLPGLWVRVQHGYVTVIQDEVRQ